MSSATSEDIGHSGSENSGHASHKPTHVVYLLLIVIGVSLLTITILDRIRVHYGQVTSYGSISIWLVLGASMTSIAGGYHLWRIYTQFYIYEDGNASDFDEWLNSKPELFLRYALFVTLVFALSKAAAVFKLLAVIPKFGKLIGMELTWLGEAIAKFGETQLRAEFAPVHYAGGCTLFFLLLVSWSVIALFKVKEDMRLTISCWIVTDTLAALFWAFCAVAVTLKPSDLEGNGLVGAATLVFGALYFIAIALRIFFRTSLSDRLAKFLKCPSPKPFAI